jgi:hypothetical protein
VKEIKMVNLHFTESEVLEALELWCQHNHTALTAHFRRRSLLDWKYNEETGQNDLVLVFDGEIEA